MGRVSTTGGQVVCTVRRRRGTRRHERQVMKEVSKKIKIKVLK